jgi:hypothetical protein
MLANACLTEDVEGVIFSLNGLVTWHLSIVLNVMFQAVELPEGIANLDASLANVYGNALMHVGDMRVSVAEEEEESGTATRISH